MVGGWIKRTRTRQGATQLQGVMLGCQRRNTSCTPDSHHLQDRHALQHCPPKRTCTQAAEAAQSAAQARKPGHRAWCAAGAAL